MTIVETQCAPKAAEYQLKFNSRTVSYFVKGLGDLQGLV